jgi:4-alpha-glucanotransferase
MSIPVFSFQPSATEEEALRRASELWGIEPEYTDTWQKRHTTAPAVQRAILRALGIPCESKQCLDRAVEERLWQEWSRILPPALVLSEAPILEISLSVPYLLASSAARVEVVLEDGSKRQYEVQLSELPDIAGAELRGDSFLRKLATLPWSLPIGYHEIRVSVTQPGGKPICNIARLIVCPKRAWLPPQLEAGGKTAGISISLFAVRSQRNWGCGDFTDLMGIIDWAAEDLGANFVALNPLHAIHNRRPFNTSPYLPNSIFYRNPIYVDVEKIEEIRSSPLARELLASPSLQAELEVLRSAPQVEYEQVHALKLRFLKLAFGEFQQAKSPECPRRKQFLEYCRRNGELLERFATYCALDEWIHELNPETWVWPEWPEPYRNPDSEAVRQFAADHLDVVEFYKYVQWQCEVQLQQVQEYAKRKGMLIGLFHDLALATDRCGSDFWAYRDYFVSGCRVGAPPDEFSPKGQDWAFPPPNIEKHRASGYRLFVESIRRSCRHGGALRIDHAMRFFRLFWIPAGMDATQGAYVRDFHEDLLRLVALESVRNKVLIVGEDLGTVAPGLEQAFQRFGILSYRLFYFEKTNQGEFRAPQEYPRRALVSASTHDLPTLAGFWAARDVHVRRAAGLLNDDSSFTDLLKQREQEKQRILDLLRGLGLLPQWFSPQAADVLDFTGELHSAIVAFLTSTPSMLFALTQEDLLKDTEQQNLPGTTWQYPNWQRKMRFTIEQLRSEKFPTDCTAMFRYWVEKSGRR